MGQVVPLQPGNFKMQEKVKWVDEKKGTNIYSYGNSPSPDRKSKKAVVAKLTMKELRSSFKPNKSVNDPKFSRIDSKVAAT